MHLQSHILLPKLWSLYKQPFYRQVNCGTQEQAAEPETPEASTGPHTAKIIHHLNLALSWSETPTTSPIRKCDQESESFQN